MQIDVKDNKSRMLLPEGVSPADLDFYPGDVSCTSCGACCVLLDEQVPPDKGYVEMLEADLVNLQISKDSRLLRRKKGNATGTAYVFLRVVPDVPAEERFYGHVVARCPFLVGAVGDAQCGVYERRPHACRMYVKGSWHCVEQRRRHYFAGNRSIVPRFTGGRIFIESGVVNQPKLTADCRTNVPEEASEYPSIGQKWG